MADSGGASGSPILAGGTIISTWFQTMAAKEMGRMARIQADMRATALEFDAWEAERRGGLAIAISQNQAAEERRQANLVASRALAVAAASGGGVSDPTMVRVIANARGEGAVRAATALYEGQARDRQLRTEAAQGRLSAGEAEVHGMQTQTGYGIAARGTVSKEAMSLYAKYGMNGPKGDGALISQPTYPGVDE